MKKAHILIFYLVIFISFIEIYTINLKIIQHKLFEFSKIERLNEFSLIESEIIINVIKKFHAYKMEDFNQETTLGIVYIYYIDETAYIEYDFETVIYAQLEYDLVYDSCYNYEVINKALFPIVDKINS